MIYVIIPSSTLAARLEPIRKASHQLRLSEACGLRSLFQVDSNNNIDDNNHGHNGNNIVATWFAQVSAIRLHGPLGFGCLSGRTRPVKGSAYLKD